MIGIEIYLGVRIGWCFFIDYGMGIVIGEIVEIGDDVIFYQGVILGGIIWNKGKCYFIFGNNVVVGVGVKVFGLFIVGEGVKVGFNVVVIKEVLLGVIVVGIFGWIIMCEDFEQQVKCQVMVEKFGFDVYGVSQDMLDLVVCVIGQLFDYLQVVDGWFEGMCQVFIVLGSDYCVKDLLVLCEEDFVGVKDEDGNLVV